MPFVTWPHVIWQITRAAPLLQHVITRLAGLRGITRQALERTPHSTARAPLAHKRRRILHSPRIDARTAKTKRTSIPNMLDAVRQAAPTLAHNSVRRFRIAATAALARPRHLVSAHALRILSQRRHTTRAPTARAQLHISKVDEAVTECTPPALDHRSPMGRRGIGGIIGDLQTIARTRSQARSAASACCPPLSSCAPCVAQHARRSGVAGRDAWFGGPG